MNCIDCLYYCNDAKAVINSTQEPDTTKILNDISRICKEFQVDNDYTEKFQEYDMELSDEIKIRLLLIRVKTLHKYREKCYNSETQALNTMSVTVL